jgi:hypothetical protein
VLERLFELLGQVGGTPGGSLLATVLLLAALAAVIVLAVRFGRRTDRGARAARPDADVGRGAPAWEQDADAHERAGRWRDALRCRYRAVVADLAGAGVIEEVPGRTAGEYLAAVGDALPEATQDFAGMTRAFEAVWYGQAEAGAEDVARVAGAGDAVRRAAGLRPRARVATGR